MEKKERSKSDVMSTRKICNSIILVACHLNVDHFYVKVKLYKKENKERSFKNDKIMKFVNKRNETN